MRILVAAALLFALVTEARAEIPANAFQDLHWRMIGPFRGGRTRAVAGVASQPNVFYMAPVNGGVWKTDDAGRTWLPIFDDQPTQSIGSIAVAPSNPKIIYAGSGEGLLRPDLSVGNGIYRSDDAGKTWRHLGLADAQQVPKIVVDPRNPERVFAAVLGHPYGPSEQRGVFRSVDGGKTWTKVLYKNPNIGASDLEIDPQHPDVIYAALWEARLSAWEDDNETEGAGGGLFKSIDGGQTWKKLAGGLPANGVQFDVAIAPSRPSTLYVTLTTTERSDYGSGKGNGLYRSDDAGATWKETTTDDRPRMKIGGGDLMVPVVDPKDPNTVYVASIVAMKSRDSGKTWTWLRGAPGGDDYQNLWINPNDSNTILLVSDQGAVITVNGGKTWSSWFNQPTAQLYHVGVTNEVPYKVCSGQQESGSVCISSRGPYGAIGERDWKPVGVIEYGYATPDPTNPDVVYGAGRTKVSRYTWSTGQVQDVSPIPVRGVHRVERTQPIAFSPVQPSVMYYAADVVFRSTNGGRDWQTISPDLALAKPADGRRGAVYALAPSYKTTATLWAGTDDGKLWVTRDAGAHWNDITPAQVTPWSKITQLDASRFDDTTVYASVSRLRVDDLAPYIYRTHDAGKTWTQITAGLPPGPVNAVRADPIKKGLLYAATENGVWVSIDDGDHWQPLQINLPHTSVRDLVVHGVDLIVATHGRGFWILDDITRLRQLPTTDALIAPAPAYRFPRSVWPDTPIPPDEPMAENPPDGAVIDYYLATAANDVAVEIVDARNQVVRRYTSEDRPDVTDEELEHQLIPAYWVAPRKRLGTTPGMHRWIWDLRGERPLAPSYGYPISAVPHATPRRPQGPRALPGKYTVRLVAHGKTLTAPLEVRIDPKLKAGAQAHELEVRLAAAVTRSSTAVLEARSVIDQLAKLAMNASLKAQVAELSAKITTLLSGKPTSLGASNGTLASLYAALDVDAAPTPIVIAEAAKAEKELAALLQIWAAIEKTDLPRLNTALAAAGLAIVKPDAQPASREGNGDEE